MLEDSSRCFTIVTADAGRGPRKLFPAARPDGANQFHTNSATAGQDRVLMQILVKRLTMNGQTLAKAAHR